MSDQPLSPAQKKTAETASRLFADTYPLISATELLSLMQQNDEKKPGDEIHILDCRFELGKPEKGRQDFDAGHIPGSLYVHIDNDLCAEKTGHNGRHPLPDFFEFVLRTQQWGLKKDSLIIATDAGNAMVAGRLWWMLRWAGYPKAKVLNGGWNAWLAADGPKAGTAADRLTDEHPVQPHPQQVDIEQADIKLTDGRAVPAMQTVDVHAVVQNLEKREFHILDGRDSERFSGRRDTMDPVAGHIPGARNRCFLDNLNADGTFKSPEQLKAEYADLLGTQKPEDIVHSCGSGVTACHNLLAMEAAGLRGSRLYPGSWSEYCADPSRPVERD